VIWFSYGLVLPQVRRIHALTVERIGLDAFIRLVGVRNIVDFSAHRADSISEAVKGYFAFAENFGGFVLVNCTEFQKSDERIQALGSFVQQIGHFVLLPASHAGFQLTQDQHNKWNKTCQVNNREEFSLRDEAKRKLAAIPSPEG
jgi:hypothetical protein